MRELPEGGDRSDSLDDVYRQIAEKREQSEPRRPRPRPDRVPRESGYEVGDRRESTDGRASIEALLPGWHWPVVRAVEDAGRWLVLADPKVAELGGVGSTHLAAGEVVSADNAMQWVNVLTALYVKAAAK
jgi:hypothetical protein